MVWVAHLCHESFRYAIRVLVQSITQVSDVSVLRKFSFSFYLGEVDFMKTERNV